jgi:hypothetical protein
MALTAVAIPVEAVIPGHSKLVTGAFQLRHDFLGLSWQSQRIST